MNPSLQQETDKLTRSWMRHDSAVLRDYLVAEVEDPRINLQSIFTRHFLLWNLFHGEFSGLMEQEYRFSGVANSLTRMAAAWADRDEIASVLHALKHGSDNAEGQEIPHYILQTFAELPREHDGVQVPNYIQQFLGKAVADSPAAALQELASVFESLWQPLLCSKPKATDPLRVLEPACGSANDFRFLVSYGLSEFIRYTGFDLCEKNVVNARELFPRVTFDCGNVFEIQAADRAYDVCYVHDLLEHLSIQGMERAVSELCRVTSRALCLHFFNMDEVREHSVQQVEDYHWNQLSMRRTRDLFASHGFEGQVLHAATFLRQRGKSEGYHNPNAYTFVLSRITGASSSR